MIVIFGWLIRYFLGWLCVLIRFCSSLHSFCPYVKERQGTPNLPVLYIYLMCAFNVPPPQPSHPPSPVFMETHVTYYDIQNSVAQVDAVLLLDLSASV